jgi:hydroxylamine dehydrogenase
MGPDQTQIEIYEESKHGVMFQAQEHLLSLDASPNTLTTRDMFIPTCATCHMSGINGLGVTHDPSERLSYYLASAITDKRPNYAVAQAKMKQVCSQCHTSALSDRVYTQGEQVVQSTNQRVQAAQEIVNGLRKEGVLTGPPFSHPIAFVYFDFWHYDGRTSKHGAFMGGADFVQWHGNYPMLQKMAELKAMADELRRQHGRAK